MTSGKIKVLVVDDSALVRKVVSDILDSDPDIEVVGTANNGKTAIFKNESLNPDVITMDIEMPIMDGLEALRRIIESNPKPVIMMSVLTQHGAEATFKALEYGAVDFIPKPSTALSLTIDDIADLLVNKVKTVHESNIKLYHKEIFAETVNKKEETEEKAIGEIAKEKTSTSKIVAIGTSTGGPSALLQVFQSIPDNFPSSIFVVQHMPEGFTRAFAERLNLNSNLFVKEAEDGDSIRSGYAYIAPGHSHMKVEKRNGNIVIRLFQSERVSGHKPSIDVLFDSIADTFGNNCIAVIMTGMGKDGAMGIKKIREKGGFTLAQNQDTSVVYGMNRVAIEIGAIEEVVSLYDISRKIIENL